MARVYRDEDFPHGMTCPKCKQVVVEGELITERLIGISDGGLPPTDDEPWEQAPVVLLRHAVCP